MGFVDQTAAVGLAAGLALMLAPAAQQSSDWGAPQLTQAQLDYAASDVLYLHAAKARLDQMLEREGRAELAAKCFDFLPTRSALDLAGWDEIDIFAHS